MFIIVNIANLNELSIVISEKVKSEVSKNKEKINIMILKKYLLTSLLPYVESENRWRFIKTFFGLTWDIKLLIENLNKVNNFIILIPELVEKKEPPIITNNKKINEKFFGVSSRETPILDILLINDNKITLKL